MQQSNEEYEQLQTREKIQEDKSQFQSYNKSRNQSKNKVKTNDLFTYSLFIFIAVLLYGIANRIFAQSTKQSQMLGLLDVYRNAVNTMQQKIKILNLTTGVPLTQQDLKQFKLLKSDLNNLQSLIQGNRSPQDSKEEVTGQMISIINNMEKTFDERTAIIRMLVAHSKEEIRKKKIQIFEKIGKKSDFQQQKVRNPWALQKLNLRTPYIDTLQRRHMQEQMQKQSERLEQKYHFSMFAQQIPLCIIVPTRNNAKNYRYEYNLQSIINQDYKNYKIVVVDDASQDGTGDLIKIFLQNSKLLATQYFFIQNKERMSAIPNVYNAIKGYCGKNDVAVLVSGDDQLLGKLVFKILNVVYQTKKPGVAYTNHFYGKLHENDFDKGYSKPYSISEIKNKLYRFVGQKFGHMRTFPVQLFLEIKEEHMRNRDGTWIQATYDETFILPMLQMACDSIEYIDEYVYLYNYGTGQNDGEIHHDIQSKAALYVRELPRYYCLEKYQKFML